MNFLSSLRFHWWFILMAQVLCLLNIMNPYNGLYILLALVLACRILCLKNREVILIIVFTLFMTSCSYNQLEQKTNSQKGAFESEQVIEGILLLDPNPLTISEDAIYGPVVLDLEGKRYPMSLYYPMEEGELDLPDLLKRSSYKIEGEFKLTSPKPARNFGIFDYQKYLSSQGIVWQVECLKQIAIQPYRPSLIDDAPFFGANLRARFFYIFRRLDHHFLVAIHNKLLYNLNSTSYRLFKNDLAILGVMHFFSISGFHLDFIRRRTKLTLLRLGIDPRVVEWVVAVLLLIFSTLIAWPIGVIRSFCYYYAKKNCRYFSMPLSSLDILAILAIILLIINPNYLLNLGFVLSFLMSALIIFHQQMALPTVSDRLAGYELNLICLLFSWPLVLNQTFQWNGAQFISLMIFGLVFDAGVMSAMFIFSALIYLSQFIPKLITFIAWISTLCSKAWNYLSLAKRVDYFSYLLGSVASWQIILLLIAGILFVYFLRQNKRLAWGWVLTIYISVLFIGPSMDMSTRLTLVDVGQGDAMLVSFPFGAGHWLIDTGGQADWYQNGMINRDFAYKNIIPALRAQGVRRLKGVIITHPDVDHIGNLFTLAQEIPIDDLFVSEYTYESELWQSLSNGLSAQTKLQIIPEGTQYSLLKGRLRIQSLKRSPQSQDPSNDSSLVTTLFFGGKTFLNTGDLTAIQEKVYLEMGDGPVIDVLKLGHHGSHTSTSDLFLAQLHPKMALISAGENNRYGHPHAEVLDRLETFAIPYLSTHQKGAIQFIYHPLWGWRVDCCINDKT